MLDTYPMPSITSNTNRFFAVIPCAGFGSRAGTVLPKQYQTIADLPLVVHTMKAFLGVQRMFKGVLVLSPDDVHMKGILAEYPQHLFESSYVGGSTRAQSVYAGLLELLKLGAQENDWVLVHDAARCLVTTEQINALIDACKDDTVGGLLAHKLADTLKAESNGRVAHTVDRTGKWLAQTPQMFRISVLTNALKHANEQVTDEASAIEALGLNPLLVPGSAQNFKVTYPEDFDLATAILNSRN